MLSPRTSIAGMRASDHLNFVRGTAALAVLAYHIRYRFFSDYSDLIAPDWATKCFYALTSFGHDAVIIFFVLSGFFISTSIVTSITEGRWSWMHYGMSRLTRLYVVLIPGLILTWLCDSLGLSFWGNHVIYTGELRSWHHDYFAVSDRLSTSGVLGNIVFLQTIYCAPYGSNDALWSLAYEFWYYLAFPLIAIIAAPRRSAVPARLISLLAILAVGLFISRSIIIYFPIWLFGLVAGQLPASSLLRRFPKAANCLAIMAVMAVVSILHLSAVRQALGNSVVMADYVTAVVFALALWVMLHDERPSNVSLYSNTSRLLSDMSYSLYVAHLPILVLVRAMFTTDAPWKFGTASVLWFGILFAGAMLFAWGLSRVTEANTEHIRRKVAAWIISWQPATASGQHDGPKELVAVSEISGAAQ